MGAAGLPNECSRDVTNTGPEASEEVMLRSRPKEGGAAWGDLG